MVLSHDWPDDIAKRDDGGAISHQPSPNRRRHWLWLQWINRAATVGFLGDWQSRSEVGMKISVLPLPLTHSDLPSQFHFATLHVNFNWQSSINYWTSRSQHGFHRQQSWRRRRQGGLHSRRIPRLDPIPCHPHVQEDHHLQLLFLSGSNSKLATEILVVAT